jgi:hypothetical protein
MTKRLSEPGAAHVRAGSQLLQLRPRVSKTRSASISRARNAEEARKGNQRALRHGINADVLNLPYVADEVALIYATHRHLDPIEDFRLVELTALAHVAHRRAQLAIEKEGMTTTLVRYEADLGKRLERFLARIHDRNLERARAAEQADTLDLRAYRVKA